MGGTNNSDQNIMLNKNGLNVVRVKPTFPGDVSRGGGSRFSGL